MTDSAEKVERAIRDSIAAALPQLETIDFDAALTGDVGLDSVQIMDLVMEIEDRLDISIPVEVLAEVQTLGQLAAKLQPMVESNP